MPASMIFDSSASARREQRVDRRGRHVKVSSVLSVCFHAAQPLKQPHRGGNREQRRVRVGEPFHVEAGALELRAKVPLRVAADFAAKHRMIAFQYFERGNVDHGEAAGLEHSEHFLHRRLLGGRFEAVEHVERQHDLERSSSNGSAPRCLVSIGATAIVPNRIPRQNSSRPNGVPYCWRKGRFAPVPQPASSSLGFDRPAVASSMRGATNRLKPRNQKCRCSASNVRSSSASMGRAHSSRHGAPDNA